MKLLLLFLLFGKLNIVIDINKSSLCERVNADWVIKWHIENII